MFAGAIKFEGPVLKHNNVTFFEMHFFNLSSKSAHKSLNLPSSVVVFIYKNSRKFGGASAPPSP